MRAVARSSTNTSLYGDNDPYLQSRIDSFLDANLVFSREFQVYVLELYLPDTHQQVILGDNFDANIRSLEPLFGLFLHGIGHPVDSKHM